MILVLLGTQNNKFERLLKEIQKCIDNKVITEDVVVQAGSTNFESDNMKIFDLIPEDELNELKKKARIIITHGGVGSIVGCIKIGKKVIAVPRLKEYGEHVNNHQRQIVETFNNQGLIKGVQDLNDLKNAIISIDEFIPSKFISNTENVIKILDKFIEDN